mmetsp:Transcript_19089/g.61496  ORF Transcript_19089/g.61496 Transcript_19089/m.61496 type:complete len:226 (-) Transcript_19089:55-732(-)
MDRRPVARPGRRHLPHKGHPRHRGQPEEVRLPGRAHDLQQRARRRVGRGRAARVEARLHRQELAARGAARRLQRLPRHPAARRAEARGAPLRGRGPRPVQGRPGRVGKGAGRRAALQEHARGGARRGRVALPGGARRRRPHLRPARRRPGHQEGVRANLAPLPGRRHDVPRASHGGAASLGVRGIEVTGTSCHTHTTDIHLTRSPSRQSASVLCMDSHTLQDTPG